MTTFKLTGTKFRMSEQFALRRDSVIELRGASTVNVRAYGAIGDGATDDAPAIQAAIDAAQDAGLYVEFEANKQYKLGASLTFKHGQSASDARKYHVRVRGNGATLYPVGAAVAIHVVPRCLLADSATGRGEASIEIEDVSVDGTYGAAAGKALIVGANGLRCSDFAWNSIRGVTVSGFTADHAVVEFVEARHIKVTELAVRAGSVSIASNTASAFCGDLVFDTCEFAGTVACRPILLSASGAGSQLRGITFSACDVYGAGTKLSSNGTASQVGDIWFDNGCQFDGPDAAVGEPAVEINGGGSGQIFQVHFASAYFVGYKAPAIYAVSGASATIYQLSVIGGGVGSITTSASFGDAAMFFLSVESLSVQDVEFDGVVGGSLIHMDACTNAKVYGNKGTRSTIDYGVLIGNASDKYAIVGNMADAGTTVVGQYVTGSPTALVDNNLTT